MTLHNFRKTVQEKQKNSDTSTSKKGAKAQSRQQPKFVCLEQNITLPSNLLQKPKGTTILDRFRLNDQETTPSHQISQISSSPREHLSLLQKNYSSIRDNYDHYDYQTEQNTLQNASNNKNTNKGEELQVCSPENDNDKERISKRDIISEKKKSRAYRRSSQNGPKNQLMNSQKTEQQQQNPLYRRLCDIQSENEELSRVSYSKMLSRMIIMEDEDLNEQKSEQLKPGSKPKAVSAFEHRLFNKTISFHSVSDSRNWLSSGIKTSNIAPGSQTVRSSLYHQGANSNKIPHYRCLKSKNFSMELREKRPQPQSSQAKEGSRVDCQWSTLSSYNHRSPINATSANKAPQMATNRLFKRYYNPHGDKADLIRSYETVQYDDRYIYRNGRKTECKRIHNFYTSHMFEKNYQKHMRNSVEGFWNRTGAAFSSMANSSFVNSRQNSPQKKEVCSKDIYKRKSVSRT